MGIRWNLRIGVDENYKFSFQSGVKPERGVNVFALVSLFPQVFSRRYIVFLPKFSVNSLRRETKTSKVIMSH